MMSALSVLIILINLFNLSHAFGCCGKKPKPHWTPRAIKAPTPTVQDIVNTYCRAGANICNLQSRGITHLEYVNFPPEITILYLSHNNIVSLKNSRFPANLVELYIAFNRLYFGTSSYSVNITHLTSLSVLNLDYNKIHGLENVYLPHNLTILSLRGNAIRSLSNLRSISSLQMLNLNYNGIKSMGTNIRDKLPLSLETLLLRENKITNIDTEIPNALTELDLRDNPLTEYHIRNWNGRCRVLTENTPLESLESNSIIDHISRLPTLVWNEKMVIQANCQICCEDFANGDSVRILPCLHKFHCDCVQSWLVDKQICPGCRHNINEVE